MAISIDEVYQTVLALANKEQRGYITPQEFNLFANQAQMEIFEQYFYDLNQFKRVPGNSSGYADMVKNLEEKISLFEIYDKAYSVVGNHGRVNLNEHHNVYRLTMVRVLYSGQSFKKAEQIQLSELNAIGDSPLTRWSKQRPDYIRYSMTQVPEVPDRIGIYPYPESGNNVYVSYIKFPQKPNWAYITAEEAPIYNDNASIDFELHYSDKSELVYRILAFAGVSIERPQLIQLSSSAVAGQVQQEKQ